MCRVASTAMQVVTQTCVRWNDHCRFVVAHTRARTQARTHTHTRARSLICICICKEKTWKRKRKKYCVRPNCKFACASLRIIAFTRGAFVHCSLLFLRRCKILHSYIAIVSWIRALVHVRVRCINIELELGYWRNVRKSCTFCTPLYVSLWALFWFLIFHMRILCCGLNFKGSWCCWWPEFVRTSNWMWSWPFEGELYCRGVVFDVFKYWTLLLFHKYTHIYYIVICIFLIKEISVWKLEWNGSVYIDS